MLRKIAPFAGLLAAVIVVLAVWNATRPSDGEQQITLGGAPTATSPATADPLAESSAAPAAPFEVSFPVTQDDLNRAAGAAAGYVEAAGTYGPDTSRDQWVAAVAAFLTANSGVKKADIEPDWDLIADSDVRVATTVTSVRVLSVAPHMIAVRVTASSDPGGQASVRITLSDKEGTWLVDGFSAADLPGEAGIGA